VGIHNPVVHQKIGIAWIERNIGNVPGPCVATGRAQRVPTAAQRVPTAAQLIILAAAAMATREE